MRQLLYQLLMLSVSIIPALGITQGVTLLNPKTQPQFKNALPIPAVINATGGGTFTIPVTQFQQDLGLKGPLGQNMLTKVWGYGGTYPGPTILAKRGTAIQVAWPNRLVAGNGKPLKHLLPVDVTLHWALEDEATGLQTYGVPIVTHIHGGQTESHSDGLPDAWYTPNSGPTGRYYSRGKETSNPLDYPNAQEAATIWYHDHALGITRLNVYAGLAGFYIITDENEQDLQNRGILPSGPYDLGLAIQDRMFTSAGQLYYPSAPMVAGAPNPSVQPEFFGDFILVNGKAWPILEVEPRQYRFRLLNGSDSRFYNLTLSSGQKFYQIGSDVGLLPQPVEFSQVLIGPGERKDVVVDFDNPALKGRTIIMQNDAPTPYPNGVAVDPLTTGRIMAFRVSKKLSAVPKTTLAGPLRGEIVPLTTNLPPRKLLLFEGTDDFGRLQPLLGTVNQDGDGVPLGWMDDITENPELNTTEIWEIYNTTPDAHPIHLHMVKMQLVNRQKITFQMGDNEVSDIEVDNNEALRQPGDEEKGWKDTYIAYPGEVTRIIAKFELGGLSAWHCHILSHEDHEMMRPYFIGRPMPENPRGGMVTKVTEAVPELEKELQLRMLPNPFNANLKVQLVLPKSSALSISVYDVTGRQVKQVFNGRRDAGLQQFTIDGSRWSNGTYFCEVVVDNQRMVRKLSLNK